ncbi:MAG: hypothetical protein QGI86_02520 [Candidatus Poribacteria bacterium]|nr:hypothetical protein [Candidatus Poribacteria bacterium]MDP6997280.1 hypothetical protein [Candidatus Poribacteria bacterium]
MQKPILFCILVGLFVPLSHAKLLMFDDFEGKLKKKYWIGQDKTWKTKNGVLEIEQPINDGNCPCDFGYGTVETESFSLQFDFRLLQDDFKAGSSMDLLFRANEFKFYQLIVTPADGVGKTNHARWYIRDGENRATWKEYRELRKEFPIEVLSKEWYTLSLQGKVGSFTLYIRKKADLVSAKVIEWKDPKNKHPKGVIGFHTNRLQHYQIDNMRLFDSPNEVNLAVDVRAKQTTFWAEIKGR